MGHSYVPRIFAPIDGAGITKRILTAAAALALSVLSGVTQAQQDNWPVKPILMVVPFSPGTPIEVPAHAVTRRMTDTFGRSFVRDYLTGASGTIGTEIVARAHKDGDTELRGEKQAHALA
jgi:tripartite-type tricarboxylate transporter receptor subunit TctC